LGKKKGGNCQWRLIFTFNNFASSGEQNLIENLIIESIKIYGVDVYYVPRKIVNKDSTFREQALTEYGEAVSIEMYIKNIDGFEGDGEFLSKFGVEVRDQLTFSVAMRVFDNEVGSVLRRDRPIENDLIWFPFNKALYQIKFVNKKPVFYQLGALQMYDVVCELFEYSNEVFNTGVEVIDNTYNAFLTTTDPYVMATESGISLFTESGDAIIEEEYSIDKLDESSQNDFFENTGFDFLDFTERDPFSEIERRA
jgi:hypothetical protein